jgi:DNA gyrase subunit A
MIINKSGLTIRMMVSDLRVMGRATQGVRLINIKGTDSIAAVTKVLREDEEVVELDEDGNPIEALETESSEEDTSENNNSEVEPDQNEE